MNTDSVLDEVQEIFQDIFDNDDLVVTKETTAADVEGWDSLNNVNLMSAIERHYKIRFALGELATMKNVNDMLELVVAKKS